MDRNELIRLRHTLDAGRKALHFTKEKSRGDLDDDEVLTLALVRLLEIMGEAASKINTETQTTHDSIPWKQIIGTRNRLIHGYDQVDLDILW